MFDMLGLDRFNLPYLVAFLDISITLVTFVFLFSERDRLNEPHWVAGEKIKERYITFFETIRLALVISFGVSFTVAGFEVTVQLLLFHFDDVVSTQGKMFVFVIFVALGFFLYGLRSRLTFLYGSIELIVGAT